MHTIGIWWPVADLFVVSIVKTRFAKNNLVFATITKMIRRTIVRVRIESGNVGRAFNRAKILFQHSYSLGTAQLVITIAVTIKRIHAKLIIIWIKRRLFNKQAWALRTNDSNQLDSHFISMKEKT